MEMTRYDGAPRLVAERHRWAGPCAGGDPDRAAGRRGPEPDHVELDFVGHGIGKVLVPLLVRPESRKGLPRNLELLRSRLEQ